MEYRESSFANLAFHSVGKEFIQNHDNLKKEFIGKYQFSLRKTVGKVSSILVTVTSRSDSDFERSNVSIKENKPDGVNPNSNDIDCSVRKNEGKLYGFRQTEFELCSKYDREHDFDVILE